MLKKHFPEIIYIICLILCLYLTNICVGTFDFLYNVCTFAYNKHRTDENQLSAIGLKIGRS